jgi:hypothetical protein
MDLLRQVVANRRAKGIVNQDTPTGAAAGGETELSREYIIAKKPKPKVVKQYLESLVNAMLEEDD